MPSFLSGVGLCEPLAASKPGARSLHGQTGRGGVQETRAYLCQGSQEPRHPQDEQRQKRWSHRDQGGCKLEGCQAGCVGGLLSSSCPQPAPSPVAARGCIPACPPSLGARMASVGPGDACRHVAHQRCQPSLGTSRACGLGEVQGVRVCASRCVHLLLFPWSCVPLRWLRCRPRVSACVLRPGSGRPGGSERGLWPCLGLCTPGALPGHQKELCRVVGVGAERGGEGRRQDRADGGSALEGSAQTSPQQGEGRRDGGHPQPRARMLEGALAHAWVRVLDISVQSTFVHPVAVYARISVRGADGAGELWLCWVSWAMRASVRCPEQERAGVIWGVHTHGERAVKLPHPCCALLKGCLAPSCALSAREARRSHALQRCAPAVRGALCGAEPCGAWPGASPDSERRCHWLHISAGDLGQRWKRLSDSVMHLPRRPAQSVWPWEAVPVASVATSGGYSSCAARCQPLGSQGGVPWGHIPRLAPGQRISTPRHLEFCPEEPDRPPKLGQRCGKAPAPARR